MVVVRFRAVPRGRVKIKNFNGNIMGISERNG